MGVAVVVLAFDCFQMRQYDAVNLGECRVKCCCLLVVTLACVRGWKYAQPGVVVCVGGCSAVLLMNAPELTVFAAGDRSLYLSMLTHCALLYPDLSTTVLSLLLHCLLHPVHFALLPIAVLDLLVTAFVVVHNQTLTLRHHL